MNNVSKNPLKLIVIGYSGFYWLRKFKDCNPFFMDYNRLFCKFKDIDHFMTI